MPARGLAHLASDLGRDITYGLGRIIKTPGFALVGVVSLAIGIGLCSLVSLQRPVPYPFFETYRDDTDGVSVAVAAFVGPVPFGVATGDRADETERVFGHLVSAEYFATLRMEGTLSGARAVEAAGTAATVDGPWFGLTLPPAFEPHVPPVIIGERGPVPATVPEAEQQYWELSGELIARDLAAIVGFSKASRTSQEIGDGQLWGRISGFPSSQRTVEWAVEQFKNAGIADAELQPFEQDEEASFWLPTSWEVRLLGTDVLGTGTRDVVLETAMPLSPSEISGTLTAPLVYVGTASPAELVGIDVEDKIAVQHVTPQGHTVFERATTVPRARDLFRRGAVAVINVVDHPGNERARDFSNCGGPCFNLGGRDGAFLRAVMNRAAEADVLDQVRAQITLTTEARSGLTAVNGVGVVHGRGRGDEYVIINAHADAWFDGAGDNADGLAVLVALARHFSRPEQRPERTLVFVASAGHHSPGLHGPRRFVTMNPVVSGNTVLVLNIEHVAQRNISPARSVSDDGYREFVADSGEAPIVAGVTNQSPFLEALFTEGVARYGTNFVSGTSTMASGEGGGYRQLGAAVVTTMQAPPLYHTSGEVLEVISTPGLERMARFLSFFVKAVDEATPSQINPP